MRKNDIVDSLFEARKKTDYTRKELVDLVSTKGKGYFNEVTKRFQYRDKDFNITDISLVPNNVLQVVFNKFINSVVRQDNQGSVIFSKVLDTLKVPDQLNNLYIPRNKSEYYKMSRAELLDRYDLYQYRLGVAYSKIDEVALNIIKGIPKKLKELVPCVIYFENHITEIYRGVLRDFNENKWYGAEWVDYVSDLTPDEIRHRIYLEKRRTDSIAAFYDKWGKTDF